MEKISDGYYYEVYDIGNCRVLKKKKSFFKIVEAIKGKSDIGLVRKLYRAYKHIRHCEKVTDIIKKSNIPKELLANPVFVNRTDYKQDRVMLLMDYFDSHITTENKVVVDKYIDLIKEFFGYGIHDNVYKFKNSYGINKEGKVVCIDFNEMVFSKEDVIKFVEIEEWRTQAQFTKFKEGELKDYIANKYKEILNPTSIDNLWDISHK